MSEAAEPIALRRATVADTAELIRLRRAMFVGMRDGDETQLAGMERALESYFPDAIRNGTFLGWLAIAPGGEVVGGGGVIVHQRPPSPRNVEPRRVDILNVIVDPEYRRRGIARRLMEEMIAWCRDQGYASVALHASADGRALYEQLGFVPTNEMRLDLG